MIKKAKIKIALFHIPALSLLALTRFVLWHSRFLQIMCKKCAAYAQLQIISWCKRCQKRKIRQSALWRQRAIAWFLKQLRFSLHVDPNHAWNHHYHATSAPFGNRGKTVPPPRAKMNCKAQWEWIAPSDARNTYSSNRMQVAFKIVPGHNKNSVKSKNANDAGGAHSRFLRVRKKSHETHDHET